MNAPHERQKSIDRWLEEVRAAGVSSDEARKNCPLHDQSKALDKAWERYYRALMATGQSLN